MTPRFEANGWQAVVADRFTFASLRLVTQAICNHIRHLQSVIDNFPPRLVVGYDNRFMGQAFSEVAGQVILENGLDVYLMDRPAPTPVVSWMISELATTGALMITGGDEAYQYNGVKFITSRMAIADEDTTSAIETELERLTAMTHPLKVKNKLGDKKIYNPKPAYFSQIARRVDLEKIVTVSESVLVDCMHGIASGYLKEILRPVGGRLTEVQNNPLSDFGGVVPALTAENLKDLSSQMQSGDYQMGILLDGDACHLQVLDERGVALSHEEICALLLDYLLSAKGHDGGLVKPVKRNDLPEKVAQLHGVGIDFSQTSDFRVMSVYLVHQLAALASDGLGGYAFEGHIMERDGLLSALLLMEMLAEKRLPLSQVLDQLYQRVAHL